MANVFDMTLKELRELPNTAKREDIGTCDGFVIVPTGKRHDSGYGCMKYVLVNHHEVVGVIGGHSDVVHLDGICGRGFGGLGRLVTGAPWCIDLLPKSKCVRVFTWAEQLIPRLPVLSDFEVLTNA